MMRQLIAACLVLFASTAQAAEDYVFDSIDGGQIDLADYRGQPVLVVNTASQCGYTYQYDGLQALQDRFGDRGLVVLAVPSNDFRQELASEEKVAEFCEVNFNLTLPMTTITHVKGGKAHPFYKWLRAEHRVTPRWNFNKVLIGPDGEFVDHFRSAVKPGSAKITGAIEPLLPKG